MRKTLAVALTVVVLSTVSLAKEKFVISFGNGGMSKYTVEDNICYTYVFNYSDKPKQVSKNMNDVVIFVIQTIKKNFEKKADGFINIRTNWQVAPDNRKIVYQVCGDLVKRK